MKKEDLKSIKINLISSFIWQILLTIPTAFTIAKYVTQNLLATIIKFEINSNWWLFLLFFIIETILIIIIIILSKKSSIVNKHNVEDPTIECSKENNICAENKSSEYDEIPLDVDYYFEEYTKHVTVYKNGNGIIMNTFTVTVNNPDNFKEFKRKLNIEDGKKDTSFPSLSTMKKLNKDKRFKEFGFWTYKSANSIVESTIEKYWSDSDPEEIDHRAQQNPQELRWVFEINNKKIKKNTLHKIAYAISIPCLYPIENGIFVDDIANEPNTEGKSSTSIHVEHYIKKITYIISFEDGIKLESEPECITVNGRRIPIYDFNLEEGIFYNKYAFTINNPSYGTNISIKWKFKGGISHG